LVSKLRPYLFALLLVIILNGFKLIYVMQFSHEYPKIELLDPPETLILFVAAMTSRHLIDPRSLSPALYGWGEYADYFGITTLALFAYLLIRKLENVKRIALKEWAHPCGNTIRRINHVGQLFQLQPLQHTAPSTRF